MTETSTLESQQNFAHIEDDSDNISEIEEEETVECSQLSFINVNSMPKANEICYDSMEKVNAVQPFTSKVHEYDHVVVEDCETDSDDDEVMNKTTVLQVVFEQVYE